MPGGIRLKNIISKKIIVKQIAKEFHINEIRNDIEWIVIQNGDAVRVL